MTNSQKYAFLVIFGFVFVGVSFFAGQYLGEREYQKSQIALATDAQKEAERVPVVKTTPKPTPDDKPKTATSTPPASFTGAFNLDVPFVPQAPQKNWDVYHEDYCEEASLLMVKLFKNKQTMTIDQMETELAAIRDWQMATFGYFESTNVAEMVRIAREYFKFSNVRVVDNPTYEQIRAEVAAGRPVVIPANGKALKNPRFKNGGPAFHVLVVRGFTENGDFITNDPGTQFGTNWVYKRDLFMAAIHDWDQEHASKTPASGTPRMIVID